MKRNLFDRIGRIVAVIIAFINIAVIVYCFCNDDKIEQKPNLVFAQPTTLTETSFFPIESSEAIMELKKKFLKFSFQFMETTIVTFSNARDELRNIHFDGYVPEPEYITQIIARKANKYDIPEQLLLEQIREENRFFNTYAISETGDYGLVQINLESHPEVTADQAFDPEFAIDFQCRYLKGFYQKYGSWKVALICYNCGEGNYLKGKVPKCTYNYAYKILSRAGLR